MKMGNQKCSVKPELEKAVKDAVFELSISPWRKAIAFPEEATVTPIIDPVHPNRKFRVEIPIIRGMKEGVFTHLVMEKKGA